VAAPTTPDAEAISRLFVEHNRMLVGYLTSRLRSVQEAKEVAQEAYVRLLQLQTPGTASLLRAYLFKTATNLAIDRMRRRAVRQAAEQTILFDELSPGGSGNDPAERIAARELAERLCGFLQELPAKGREAFDLHRLQGVAQREVGEHLGLSERMVRRYVTYAMVYCRLRLDGLPPETVREQVSL
jgi:RNA polymerase sigma factor (sigma-70 family)